MESVPFRESLGALLYLCTRTGPEIATAVSTLSKFQSDPGVSHWKMLKHLVRYLIGTTNFGTLLQSTETAVTFRAWSDADWAHDHSKRRSRSSFVLQINFGSVIWCSRLQSATAQSSSEAEFFVLSSCIRCVRWCRNILEELELPMPNQLKSTTITLVLSPEQRRHKA